MNVPRERLDAIARRLHYALAGECPAYPGEPSACNPMMCDCLSPFEEMTVEELAEEVVKRLRPYPTTPNLNGMGDPACWFCHQTGTPMTAVQLREGVMVRACLDCGEGKSDTSTNSDRNRTPTGEGA